MKHYKIIAHTADIRLFVEGTTLQELFSAALEGMAHIIAPQPSHPPYNNHYQLTLTSPDATALLIDFLSAVLTQTHITKTLFSAVDFDQLEPTKLKATIHGNNVPFFEEDIKAVTYHEANITINKNGNHQTTIVFDI